MVNAGSAGLQVDDAIVIESPEKCSRYTTIVVGTACTPDGILECMRDLVSNNQVRCALPECGAPTAAMRGHRRPTHLARVPDAEKTVSTVHTNRSHSAISMYQQRKHSAIEWLHDQPG